LREGLHANLDVVCRIILPNEQVRYIENQAKAIFEKDKAITRIVGTSNDVTEQHLLNDMKQKALDMAKESLRLKSEFLASMSHEIRTPMNGVLGMLELLDKSGLNAKQQHYLSLASSSAFSLLNLINDILDFSKVEAGKLNLEVLDFDLNALFGEIAESFAVKAQDKELEIVLDVSEVDNAIVRGDPTRVRQILTNIVGNAIKFTEQGEIVISASLKKEALGVRLTCQVKDTGIGISPDKLEGLFDSFTQVDSSTTRKYGGTGLGLAIVKKLCKLMDGEITVSSEIGKGSEFTINILLAPTGKGISTFPCVDINNCDILIVDDNKSNLAVLGKQLSLWGANVTLANSGREAIDIVNQHAENKFHVALIDMQMPKLDGVTLGKQLKHNPKCQHIKLVLMSSMGSNIDTSYINKHGFNGYFPKPATTNDLYNAFSNTWENSSQSIQNTEQSTYQSNVSASKGSELAKNIKILLVEDNRINQAVIQGMLATAQSKAEIANNGLEAIKQLKNSTIGDEFHVILMDCQMPEMDGYQATKAIRKGKAGVKYKDIPIVAMTANAMKGDKEKCLQAGMSDYLSKPVDCELLISKLNLWGKKENIALPELCSGDIECRDSHADDVSDDTEVEFEQGWDKEGLRKRVRGNDILVRNLVELYLDDTPEQYNNLLKSIESNDNESVVAKAHKLKGSARNIGAVEFARVTGDIERAGKAKDWQLVSAKSAELTARYHQLMSALEGYLETT